MKTALALALCLGMAVPSRAAPVQVHTGLEALVPRLAPALGSHIAALEPLATPSLMAQALSRGISAPEASPEQIAAAKLIAQAAAQPQALAAAQKLLKGERAGQDLGRLIQRLRQDPESERIFSRLLASQPGFQRAADEPLQAGLDALFSGRKARIVDIEDHKGQHTLWVDVYGPRPGGTSRVSKNGARLTVHGLRLTENGDVAADETLRLSLEKGTLVTVHEREHPSVEKTMRLLEESGSYKSAKDLMAFIVGDAVNGYGKIVDSLAEDFRGVTEKLDAKGVDESVLNDAEKAGRKMDVIYDTILKQKHLMQDLLAANEFHESPEVPSADLEKQARELDHHLSVLDHYQDRKNGLVDLYRAEVSNELDDAMKRLASIGLLTAPFTIVAGLMGMNVAIPGMRVAYMFWVLVTGAAALSGAMYVWFKKKRWI